MAFSRASPWHLVAMVIAALLTRSSVAATDAQQCSNVADFLFILDSSGSIGQDNYDIMKTFVATLVDSFTIGQKNVQFSLIIFSNTVTTVFNFGQYNTKDDLKTAIQNVPYVAGGTDTASALRLAREFSFTSLNGARENANKLAIVLTDGASNNANKTANEAQLLKDSGVSVFAIGVGQNADRGELQTIASDPSFVYEVDNFNVLGAISGTLVNTTCKATDVQQCSNVADILFILDSPVSIGQDNYDIIKTFVATMVDNFTIGQNNVQFSMMIVSDAVTTVFSFGQYNTKDDLKTAIQNVPYVAGGTDIASALRLAREFSFTSENGARENVKELVIVLTDGVSNDANKTANEAQLLKDSGVTVFAIGVGQNADRRELQTIASDPSFVYEVDNFNVLGAISGTLVNTTCKATDAPQCSSVADIQFVMDSSGSIGQDNYDKMKTFVATLVDSFAIGQKNVQFSMIIFSNAVTTVFNFNQYNSKDDLKTAIQNVPYVGGGTDTASALRLVREFSFTSVNGARENATKLTIVLTDGASNDANQTANEAQSLKDSGVTVFVIGVGQNVDRRELQTIASDPSFVYEVDNFNVLGAIRGSLVNTTCKESNKIETCIRQSCSGRANGNYPACDPECKKGYFYSCSNELTYRMDCALGWYTRRDGSRFTARLVFNPPTNTCEREVPQCSRDPEEYEVPLPPTSPNAGSLPPPTNTNQNSGSTSPPPNTNGAVTCVSRSCFGRPNGNYPACDPECKKGYFISCSNGYTYRMDCPLGWYVSDNGTRFLARLVYNPPTDSCERETRYCPRNPEDYPVPVPPTQPPLITPNNRPCLRSPNECVGKLNGNYPKCYPECQKGLFYFCSNNASIEMSCALAWYTDSQGRRYTDKMVYDPRTDACQLDSTSCPRQTTTSGPATITLPPDTSIPPCEAQTDVLFILDSSGSITSENYAILLAFVANLTKYFSLGLDRVLVSAMIFSTNVQIEFGFTSYLDNAGLYQAILSVPYLESGTDTALALRMARESAFTTANGARPSANKAAVVLTDGISNNPTETATEAELLRQTGVKVLAIGIGTGVVYSELEAIASSPSLVFNVSGFNVLSTIAREVVITTCQTLPPTLPPSTLSSCVSGSCSNRPDGTYAACLPECRNGDYYVCTNGSAQKQTCDVMVITENGRTFTVRGVYDPDLQACKGRSNACPGNK